MRTVSVLPAFLLLGCGTTPSTDTATPVDTGDTAAWSPTGNLCGTVERPEGAPAGGDVFVATVAAGETACASDTGGWYGTTVAQPELVGDQFEATLDPGVYGVEVTAGNWAGCASVSITDTETCAHEVLVELGYEAPVDKPNVYLYPPSPERVRVAIPPWRRITEADPVYPQGGWSVRAFPDGRLATAQGARDYLFYELRWPQSRFQTEEGWCVPGAQAQASIEEAMADLGFLPNEIADFSEAWDPAFPRAEFMTVYPQFSLSALTIDPAPDQLLRTWFYVTEGCQAVPEPELTPVPREGFHAAEWGVSFAAPLDRGDLFVGGRF